MRTVAVVRLAPRRARIIEGFMAAPSKFAEAIGFCKCRCMTLNGIGILES